MTGPWDPPPLRLPFAPPSAGRRKSPSPELGGTSRTRHVRPLRPSALARPPHGRLRPPALHGPPRTARRTASPLRVSARQSSFFEPRKERIRGTTASQETGCRQEAAGHSPPLWS